MTPRPQRKALGVFVPNLKRPWFILSVFLASLGCLAAAYLGVVRWVDPYGNFTHGPRRFPLLIQDSRPEKLRLFEQYRLKGSVEGLVLGSSRCQLLDPKQLNQLSGKRFFNFSVGSAMAEELLATYRWVRHRNEQPSIVLIGLDVESLHSDDRLVQGFRRQIALNRMLLGEGGWRSLERAGDLLDAYKQAFTIPFAWDLFRTYRLGPDSGTQQENGFDGDGSVIGPPARYSGEEREARIVRTFDRYLDRFREMDSLSSWRQSQLESLIAEAMEDGAQVIVWLTPIHPRTEAYLADRSLYMELLQETRRYLESLEGTLGVETRDFSTLESFDGDPQGWTDGAHLDHDNAAKMAARLAEGLNRRR